MSSNNGTAKTDNALALASEQTGIQEAEIQRFIESEREQALAGIDFRPPRIGIEARTQQFSIQSTGELVKELEGVVIFAHKARGYWEEGDKVPVCSSLNGKTGQERGENGGPSSVRSCATCPFNQFGSDGAGKACKEMRRLFILQDDSAFPSLLTLPPTSIRAWDDYVVGVVGQRSTPSTMFLRTKLSLEKQEDKARGYTWSTIRASQGEKLDIAKAFELKGLRDRLEIAAAQIGIEADDYGAVDVEAEAVNSEEPAAQAAAGGGSPY